MITNAPPPSSAGGAQCKEGKACGRRSAGVHAGERGAYDVLATIPCRPVVCFAGGLRSARRREERAAVSAICLKSLVLGSEVGDGCK